VGGDPRGRCRAALRRSNSPSLMGERCVAVGITPKTRPQRCMCICRTNRRQERRQGAVGAESVSARQRSGWSRDLVEWSPVCCPALPRISTIEEALKAAEGDADSRLDPLANRGAVCKCSPKMSQGLIATGILTASWHKFCVLRAACCVRAISLSMLQCLVDLGA
jgi:hypothetical protein